MCDHLHTFLDTSPSFPLLTPPPLSLIDWLQGDKVSAVPKTTGTTFFDDLQVVS